MAQRTGTELKVFLNGDYENQYSKLTDKAGTVFFDKTRRAVYAEGVLITSDVVDIKVEGSILKVKKVGETEYTNLADLAIPNEFVRFNEAQNLTDVQKQTARTNIGAEAADDTILKQGNVVNNLTSDSPTAPLSAAQGKELKRQIDEKVTAEEGKGLSANDYTNKDKTKLDGIAEGAQKNRVITVNGNNLGDDEQTSAITITGNLITLENNGEDGKMDVSLYVEYSSNDKKIYFSASEEAKDKGKVAEIDVSDFIKDSFVKEGYYDSDEKQLILTLVTGKNDDGLDITEQIKIPVGDLIDEYTAGDGIDVTNNVISANLGNGLQFDSSSPKKITLKLPAKSGLNVTTNGLVVKNGYGLYINELNEIEVDIDTENGLKWTSKGKFGVDFTKAPVQSVNGQTGLVNIDVTPKVWSF